MLIRVIAIQAFFYDWYLATKFASQNAGDQIDAIVQEVDPPKETNVALNFFLTALTAGLGFLGQAGLGTAAATAAGQALTVGFQQAPGVAKAIWPTGTVDVSKSLSLPVLLPILINFLVSTRPDI